MLDRKAFFNSYQDNCFFFIQPGNQELIYHIHCFEYIFCYQSKTIKFSWFDGLLSYGLYFKFYSLSVLYIFYSTIHLYIDYNFLFTLFAFLYLLRMNTFLASIQQILQLQYLRFHLSFFQWLICLNHHSTLT